MANFKHELRSGYNRLRGLREDLHAPAFARMDWNDLVLARRTLGPDKRIEHGFLAEHFLVTWTNWRGLLDRFCRYFGQSEDTCPKTWAQLSTKCEVLVFTLARERELDKIIAESWFVPEDPPGKLKNPHGQDVLALYSQIVQSHERADALNRAENTRPRFAKKEIARKEYVVPDRGVLLAAKAVVNEQNEALVERWHESPRRVQDQTSVHLRHYLHSTLSVSWLVDPAPVPSALLNIFWRRQPVSVTLKETVGPFPSDSRTSETVDRLLDRLKAAIAELGYEAVLEDLLSPELDRRPGRLAPPHSGRHGGARPACRHDPADPAGRDQGLEWERPPVVRQGHAAGQSPPHRITRGRQGSHRLLRHLGLGLVPGGAPRRAGSPRQKRRSLCVHARRSSRPRARSRSR